MRLKFQHYFSVKKLKVCSSIFGFTSDLTLVLYVPARNKAAIFLSSHHHDDTWMGGEKDHKPGNIMHYNATKIGFDIPDECVREHTCTRSSRCPFCNYSPV
jgi:hypothetical protein